MSVGCCVSDCWYERNTDRLCEFKGLNKVVIKKPRKKK